MTVDERRWLELADAARRALGDEPGTILMELLSPIRPRVEETEPDPVVRWDDLRWALLEVLAPLLNRRFTRLGERITLVESHVRRLVR